MKSNSDSRETRRTLEEQRMVLSERIADAEHRLGVPIEPSPDRLDLTQSRISRERSAILLAESKQLLDQIEAALRRIDDGSYGTCAACGEEIMPTRLRAIPYASLCIRCQTRQEEKVSVNL
ncbi:MAG: TraR/DksA family transcriptional regulator [Chloroflexi bacterium]|nr:TraR/DksA family transcriptional regulator [Chloroflexota bacterium]